MCAFIDDLVDAFGDDAELTRSTPKNAHPYLPTAFSKASSEAPYDKLTAEAEVEGSSQDNAAIESREVDSILNESHPYLPSPSGKHHRYLPKHKEAEPSTRDVNQDKSELVADITTSLGDDMEHATPLEGETKLFQRPNAAVHSYLFQTQPSERPKSSSLVDENIAQSAHTKKIVETKSEEGERQEAMDAPGDKLDIDALIAALPPKAAEPNKGAPLRKKRYADAKSVLEADPELQARMSSFLCYEMDALSLTHPDYATSDVRIYVPVR